MSLAASEMRVVICGGGVVGAACAYYLTLRGVSQVTIVERAAVACHASGKAGGFLAKGWGTELMDRSYELHAELGQTLVGTDYRTVETLQVSIGSQQPGRALLPGWADQCQHLGLMGTHQTTAQVHPRKFTEALVAAAQQRGATLKIGVVQSIATTGSSSDSCQVTGVTIDGCVLECDRVIVALGPWSSKAAEWFPNSIPRGISGQKYTSIVLPTGEGETTPHCLFTDSTQHVELYPRPDELYACGAPESSPVPEDPLTIQANPDSVVAIGKVVAACSSTLGAPQRLKSAQTQACFLPTSPDGDPLIGAIPGVAGAYIATGHSCWGILNAPATGLGMAELIMTGHATSVDLSPYNPARFV